MASLPSSSGLIGDLQRGVAEIGWANLFVTRQRLRHMDLTGWYLVDPTCFLFRRREPYHGIYSFYFPLEGATWIGILVTLAVVAVFYLAHSLAWPSVISFGSSLLYEMSVLFKESHHKTHAMTTHGLR